MLRLSLNGHRITGFYVRALNNEQDVGTRRGSVGDELACFGVERRVEFGSGGCEMIVIGG